MRFHHACKVPRRLVDGLAMRRSRGYGRGWRKFVVTVGGLSLALSARGEELLSGGVPPPPPTEAIVDFNTLCADCHAGECSGRLSFDSGPAGVRSHIERYRGETHETTIAELFAMLRHVKEHCSHYPVVPLRPAVGVWEAGELAPWRNDRAGAYFIPLGKFALGRRQLVLTFDRPADGSARIDDDRLELVADERLCRDTSSTLAFDASPTAAYYLHLKSGDAVLRRIVFQ